MEELFLKLVCYSTGGIGPIHPSQLHPATVGLQEPQAFHLPEGPVVVGGSLYPAPHRRAHLLVIYTAIFI